MLKQILRFRVVVVIFIVLSLFCSSEAFAWGHRDDRYYFHGGRWYKPSRFWFDVAVPVITIGAIVESLPSGYTTVVVRGAPYYYYDNVYFQTYQSGGYIVAPSPIAVPTVAPKSESTGTVAVTSSNVTNTGSNPPGTTQQDAFTVNIPNTKGGYTPVVIKKAQGGFTGPQGEFYTEFPSVEQLKIMYGNKKD